MSDRQRIVWSDEEYDRSYSSDGVSRFGAYLRQRSGQFDDDGRPLPPVWFASLVWQIATGPTMAPAYVQRRSDVHRLVCRGDENDPDVLVVEMQVPLPHPAQVWDMRAAGWRDWIQDYSRRGDDEPFPLVEPEQYPRLLFTAEFAVAIPGDALPAPTSTEVDVDVAKHAVATVSSWVNRKIGPDLESLLIRWQQRPEQRSGWRR